MEILRSARWHPMETLARYIIRASFSQEGMQYLAEPSKVVYRAREGSEEKVFDALEWPGAMCSHIPDKRAHGSVLKILQNYQSQQFKW